MSGSAAFMRGVFASPFVLIGIAVVAKWPLATISIILLMIAVPIIQGIMLGNADAKRILEREDARRKRLVYEATVGALSPPPPPAPPVETLELVLAWAAPGRQDPPLPLPIPRLRRRTRR